MAKRTPPFPFKNFDHLSLAVEDLRETVRFYEQFFGFTVSHERRLNKSGLRAVTLTKQGRSLELFEYQPPGQVCTRRRSISPEKPEKLRQGVRGIASRKIPETSSRTRIRQVRNNSLTPPSPSPIATPVLRDSQGKPLRPFGTMKRRKKPVLSAETASRPSPFSRKRKVKQ
jgi:catechol 2,3-dioxygenase-like lactoylglutathione lyase family enzyme